MNLFSKVFVFVSLIMACACDYDDSDAANAIIESNSNLCLSMDKPWTQRALDQSARLEALFQNLQSSQEEACKNLGATLEQLHSVSGQLHGIIKNQSFSNYRIQEEYFQDLTLAVSKAKDAGNDDLYSLLIQELAIAQSDLARVRAEKSEYDDSKKKVGFNDVYSVNTRDLASKFSTINSYTPSIAQCLRKNPSAYIELFGNLASIGGSFASPIIGMGAQIVAGFAGTATQYLQNRKVDKLIAQVQEDKMGYALTCGLESMTNFYCQADESLQILDIKKKYSGTPMTHPIWVGLDILTHNAPVLNNWLLGIKKGVPPQDEFDSRRFKRALQMNMMLDIVDADLTGALVDTRRKIRETENLSTKLDFYRMFVFNQASLLSGSNERTIGPEPQPNPFRDLSSSPFEYACWLMIGLNQKCPDFPTFPSDAELTTYIKNSKFPQNGDSIEDIVTTNWPSILEKAKAKVDVDFSDAILINPERILADAIENHGNYGSPRTALVTIRTFLNVMRNNALKKRPHRLPFIDFNLAIICHALNQIDGTDIKCPIPPGNRSQFPTDNKTAPLVVLYNVFKLKFPDYFLKNISSVVEMDLQDHLDDKDFPKDIEEILRGASIEISHRLKAAYPASDSALVGDLNSAMPLSESNVANFAYSFPMSLDRALKSMKIKAVKEPEGITSPNRQNLAKLCIMVLAAHEYWPNYIDWESCRNAKFFGFNESDPKKFDPIVLSSLRAKLEDLQKKDYLLWKRDRMCTYYKFMRADRIKGQIHIKDHFDSFGPLLPQSFFLDLAFPK